MRQKNSWQSDSTVELYTPGWSGTKQLLLWQYMIQWLSTFNELIWFLAILCHVLCSNIIFPQVLNIASGVIQNNYLCKHDIKPEAFPKTKTKIKPPNQKHCDLLGNSLCPADSFEWHFKADYLALFRQISHCNQHPSCVCLNRDFALIRNIELGS